MRACVRLRSTACACLRAWVPGVLCHCCAWWCATGQRGIDGGGFKLVAEQADSKSAYLYVQFESQRKGYIDDMEASPRTHARTHARAAKFAFLLAWRQVLL